MICRYCFLEESGVFEHATHRSPGMVPEGKRGLPGKSSGSCFCIFCVFCTTSQLESFFPGPFLTKHTTYLKTPQSRKGPGRKRGFPGRSPGRVIKFKHFSPMGGALPWSWARVHLRLGPLACLGTGPLGPLGRAQGAIWAGPIGTTLNPKP